MSVKMMRRQAVLAAAGFSNSTLHRLEKAGIFPKRRRLSIGIVSWLESEVENWIVGRLAVSTETAQKVAPGAKRGRKPKVMEEH